MLARSMRAALAGTCAICRQWIAAARHADAAAVCGPCIEAFGQPRPRCARCAAPWALPQAPCARCRDAAPPWRSAVAAIDYGYPWDRLLVGFKRSAHAGDGRALAGLILGALQRLGKPPIDLVAPVPLAPLRLRERGFNQAWELARRVAGPLGLPARPALLARPVETPLLAELTPPQRAEALRNAFIVEPRAQGAVRGRRIALVDDVMTTGATLAAATRALMRMGAAEVHVWVVARTPAEGESA